jgi:hypothetical protein
MSVASTRASKKSSFCTPGRQNKVSMPAIRIASTTCWAIVRVWLFWSVMRPQSLRVLEFRVAVDGPIG